MCEEVQERRQRRMQQFLIDVGPHAEELPHLAVLEADLKNLTLPFVGHGLDLWIKDLHSWNIQWRDEVTAVFDLLFAFPAKHHDGIVYRTYVR